MPKLSLQSSNGLTTKQTRQLRNAGKRFSFFERMKWLVICQKDFGVRNVVRTAVTNIIDQAISDVRGEMLPDGFASFAREEVDGIALPANVVKA